ncbi:PD-(D/E)XK nuclease-like domain-containing protein [Chitinophaga parva]|nr:PD-(D/E)XK nuclease-like domain-containing protein [Chitinophaga parva]
MKDPYYGRPEVSNSDLSMIKKYWQPQGIIYDLEQAYKFGTLIDCMITEPHKVDYFRFSCAGEQYTREDFERAELMKKAFYRDPLCAMMAKRSSFQKVSIRQNFGIDYSRFSFSLDVRCKWDLFIDEYDMSGDIKSTTATSQKQFEDAVRYFDYDRQRAWYLDIEERSNDMLIGISKVNFKVFKVPVKRGSDLYKSGRDKYQELAFKHAYLFDDIRNIRISA